MLRTCLLASAMALLSVPAHAAASLYTDLYGKSCKVIETDKGSGATTRRCNGVGGYSLLVHEANAQTSIDIVTPAQQVYPLEYWEVVTPGLSTVGRKAEWRVELRNGRAVPTALLVRLDTASEEASGPRIKEGAIITAARIERDGACVVYQGNGTAKTADAEARTAVQERVRKCLGVFSTTARAGEVE